MNSKDKPDVNSEIHIKPVKFGGTYSKELDYLIKSLYVCTSDVILNEMISLAIDGIKKPNESDRIYALEKLWDAFERMKTYYPEKKRQATEQLIDYVSAGTDKFDELLDEEFRKLTNIGDKYQIRHFGQNKIIKRY